MTGPPRRPRVLLADDHLLVAEALKSLLTPEFDLVGVVEDGRQLLEAVIHISPGTWYPFVQLLKIFDRGRRGKNITRQQFLLQKGSSCLRRGFSGHGLFIHIIDSSKGI